MSLDIIIIILFLGIVASLFSSLTFLFKDIEVSDSKRTLYALGVRIFLAASLMILIGIKINSGEIKNTAPWGDHKSLGQQTAPIQALPGAQINTPKPQGNMPEAQEKN